MPFDGVFLHYLVNELNDEVLNYKVNKVYQPSPMEIVLQLRGKNKDGLISNKQLYLSSKLDKPRLNLSNLKYQNPVTPSNFCMLLRKYIERSELIELSQYENDRVICLKFKTYNDLDDLTFYSLYLEIMGRNSNLILCNQDDVIIDALRKLAPSEETSRIVLPHAHYYHLPSNKVNPYKSNSLDVSLYEGMSLLIQNEVKDLSYDDMLSYINQPKKPIIFKNGKKKDFYCFNPNNSITIDESYPTLSLLLEAYYNASEEDNSYERVLLEKDVRKFLKKAESKKDNLLSDLNKAKDNLKYNDIGILLQANLYMVKKGDTSIIVNNFLNENEPFTITLDPLKDPSENLKAVFALSKKAKTAMIKLKEQLDINEKELIYLDNILFQISKAFGNELKEIKDELTLSGYYKASTKKEQKRVRSKPLQFEKGDYKIYIGKNNLQNEYLTCKFAHSNDYWFHAKDMPGSHVILRYEGSGTNNLSEDIIRTCANLAALYSKGETSNSVPVDYTLVRYIKKIPGFKGYHVTYTNQKTIYIDPERECIKDLKKI